MNEENFGKAVIKQAFVDACSKSDNYDRVSARNFLCGVNRIWLKSFKDWCWVANENWEDLLSKMRSIWGKNGKEEHIPSQDLLIWLRKHLLKEEEWLSN